MLIIISKAIDKNVKCDNLTHILILTKISILTKMSILTKNINFYKISTLTKFWWSEGCLEVVLGMSYQSCKSFQSCQSYQFFQSLPIPPILPILPILPIIPIMPILVNPSNLANTRQSLQILQILSIPANPVPICRCPSFQGPNLPHKNLPGARNAEAQYAGARSN